MHDKGNGQSDQRQQRFQKQQLAGEARVERAPEQHQGHGRSQGDGQRYAPDYPAGVQPA